MGLLLDTLPKSVRGKNTKVARINTTHKNKYACHKLYYLVQFDRYLDYLLCFQITQNRQWSTIHNPAWKTGKQGENRGSNFPSRNLSSFFTCNRSVFDLYLSLGYCSVFPVPYCVSCQFLESREVHFLQKFPYFFIQTVQL